MAVCNAVRVTYAEIFKGKASRSEVTYVEPPAETFRKKTFRFKLRQPCWQWPIIWKLVLVGVPDIDLLFS